MLTVGDIYSTSDGNGRYRIVKLLAHTDGVCHLRVYKQKFSDRPLTIDIASLSLGKVGDPDGFGIGHIPQREAGFLQGWPMLLSNVAVTPEELEGYEIWRENGGGVF